MTVLAAMGGKERGTFWWDRRKLEPQGASLQHIGGGVCGRARRGFVAARSRPLADELFKSDETLTRQDVRAVTVAKLMPMRGALLWDIGTGCGSVAVEWMRAARYARAIGIEPFS